MNKIEALRRTALFSELDQSKLTALAARAIERRFEKDEVLFVAGEEARGLYVIVEGGVRAFRESIGGREQVIHVERAGATVAEVPVFDDGPFPSTVAAEEDTTVLFIDKRDVRLLCMQHPEITLAALKVLATRLRRCAELVETLSLREVGQRLARFLLTEARRRGRRKEGQETSVHLTLTNQQVAARIGTVREVVSRALARLEQDGLIQIKGRLLIIPDENALAEFADQQEP